MIDSYAWTNRAQLMKDAFDADQAEVEAVLGAVVATTVAMYDERIAEELEPEGDLRPRIEEQLAADIELDTLSGRILEEIERRIDLLGENYPFILQDGSLAYRPSVTGVYEYCLALSAAPNLTTGAFCELPRYFEILAGDVARHYLGDGSHFIRSGWPAYPEDAAIRTFRQAMEHLHQETSEWYWDPDEDAAPDLPNIADEGLDFVAWKPIDRRKGRVYIIGQCACGRTDWADKHDDLTIKRLKRWVKMPPVIPIRAFAIPHAVTASKVFGTLSGYAGIPFDRVRLTQIANAPAHIAHFRRMHSPTLLRLAQLVIQNAALAPLPAA